MKKANRTIILLTSLMILILLTGCKGGSSDPVVNTQYRSGSEALKMEFIKNMPTKSLFAGETFNLGLQLENAGAYDIASGTITISGYEKKQYTFKEGNTKTFELAGKSQFTPKGEMDAMIFEVKSECFPSMAKHVRTNLTTVFRATACYEYATESTAQVCIDTNPLASQNVQTKVCQVKPISLSGGQGGPVGVTKVEPTMIPQNEGVRARFLIYLRNLNEKGTVYSSSAYSSTKGCEDSTLQNKVNFEAYLSDNLMTCTPAGEITLRVGEETRVSCEINLAKLGGVYETNLKINTRYAYSHDISTKVNVEKPLDVQIQDCADIVSTS